MSSSRNDDKQKGTFRLVGVLCTALAIGTLAIASMANQPAPSVSVSTAVTTSSTLPAGDANYLAVIGGPAMSSLKSYLEASGTAYDLGNTAKAHQAGDQIRWFKMELAQRDWGNSNTDVQALVRMSDQVADQLDLVADVPQQLQLQTETGRDLALLMVNRYAAARSRFLAAGNQLERDLGNHDRLTFLRLGS